MPPWDNEFVCQSYLVNMILQQVIEDENNNKDRQQPKIQLKSARRKCQSNLNHNIFSENFIYDPLNVFPKPMSTISIGILW